MNTTPIMSAMNASNSAMEMRDRASILPIQPLSPKICFKPTTMNNSPTIAYAVTPENKAIAE